MAQSVRSPSLDFSLGVDLRVLSSSPRSGSMLGGAYFIYICI